MLQEERIICYDKELDIEAYRFRGRYKNSLTIFTNTM